MALHWNIEKIKDHDTLCYRENEDGTHRLDSKTEALIWLCGSLDFTEITEKNYIEFAVRLYIHQALFGEVAGFISLADVKARIGLSTNWGGESKTKWFNRTYKNAIAEMEARDEYLSKEQEEAR